jgi:hypothetical protein
MSASNVSDARSKRFTAYFCSGIQTGLPSIISRSEATGRARLTNFQNKQTFVWGSIARFFETQRLKRKSVRHNKMVKAQNNGD